ncbi:hypothetical protein M1N77_03555 [Thermodesulfovibrionales bacterium]|nr:hypothetical protein [Thermodesulfovibrionales bacterium]
MGAPVLAELGPRFKTAAGLTFWYSQGGYLFEIEKEGKQNKISHKKISGGAFRVIDEHGGLVGTCKDEDELVALEDELVALNKGHLFRLGGELFCVGDKERYSSYDVIMEAFMKIR